MEARAHLYQADFLQFQGLLSTFQLNPTPEEPDSHCESDDQASDNSQQQEGVHSEEQESVAPNRLYTLLNNLAHHLEKDGSIRCRVVL